MSETAASNIDNIDSAIQQAELLQTKLQLNAQLVKNLNYFKRVSPKLYDIYKDYKPEKHQIYVDSRNSINLLNVGSRKPVYYKNSQDFAEEQIDEYLKNPKRLFTLFSESDEWNEKHIHVKCVNQAISSYKSLNIQDGNINSEKIGLLVLVGCGLGYQIQAIMKRCDIQNLVIYDSERDSFYATLYTVDWENISQHFNKKGGKIKLIAGETYQAALAETKTLMREIGLFNMVTTYLLMHTYSKEHQEFHKQYRKEFHLNAFGTGFIDDEQISLAHTVDNLKANVPLLIEASDNKKLSTLPPVMIVGNGPSLDNLADSIRENISKAIIISCGSAICSLYKMGIKPDIHIEMERSRITAQWIELGTDLDYTQSIILMGLNTISPALRPLFKKTYIATKTNDLGCEIIKNEYKQENIKELGFCNPTVANCGLALAINLGFEDIYLIGTDFGMRVDGEHHSKSSIFHEIAKKEENQEMIEREFKYKKGQYRIKGNFCDEVFTTNTLDMARKSMEIALMTFDHVNCYNPNDGAFIEGTTKIEYDKVIVIDNNNINKADVIDQLLSTRFTHKKRKITENSIRKKYLLDISKLKDGFTLPENVENIVDLHRHISKIFFNLKKIEKQKTAVYFLLMGSIDIQITLLFYYCSNCDNKENFEKCYQIGRQQLNQFFNQATELINGNIFRLDDSIRTIH